MKTSRDGFDDTVPARDSAEVKESKRPPEALIEEAPVRPTLPMDRYRIGTELGRGGMGRVVEAFDVQLGRNVALKEVLTKGTHRRFAREIHITARLEHASIVPLYDSGINSDGKPFYVMRKVTGKPLDEMVAACRDLDERLTLLPAVQAAIDAIAHAHSRGIIHRDIKPQNILVGEHGETTVIDWGLAKVIGEADEEDIDTHVPSAADSLRTQVGSVFGTPGFMAPEQARGEALDTQGDVYALGATLYQLLSGEPPVRGVSATEVMDKTRTHDIRPLSEAAPGAPPDLVAIVAKALAFDPTGRYRDAGELGEDVRRFLGGQLVAAHDYTRWQRLARFARRHRGILAVAAFAAVAVAVMSWIGVHRIITERDAAEQARHEADLGKREAEDARDRLADRADQMVVMQARAALELDPTESLAMLKQLSATSKRRDEARALGQAAVVRGAAWAMQTTATVTVMASLAPDGRHLVQASFDGIVRVFDLDARRMISSQSFAVGVHADWLADNRLLITGLKSPPKIFDPVTNKIESLAGDPVKSAWSTASGDKLLLHTSAQTAVMFDSATHAVTPLPYPEPVETATLAPDGSWYALAGKKTITVYDSTGKELTHKDLKAVFLVPSRARTFALMEDTKNFPIHEVDLNPATPTWTQLPSAASTFWFAYRGRELTVFERGGDIMGWRGTRLFRRATYDRASAGMYEAGNDALVYLRDDGKLIWINDIGQGTFVLPASSNHNKIASRAGSPRVAIVGDGLIQVFDLGFVLPRKVAIPNLARAVFVDDDTLLVIGNAGENWSWYDIPTGKQTAIEFRSLFLPVVWDVDGNEGRVLVRDQRTNTDGGRFMLLRKSSPTPEGVAEGDRTPFARLIPGDALIYGLGDAQVFAKVGKEPAKMIAKVDGVANQGVGLGSLQYAVHASSGEVLRGDLRTGAIERVRVPSGTSGFVSSDGAGHAVIVEDNRLMIWDSSVDEVAKFDREIKLVTPVDGGIVVQVGREEETFVLDAKPRATPHRVLGSSAAPPRVTQKLLVTLGNAQELQLVEFPSRAKWTFPSLAGAQKWIDISPTGRYLIQQTDAGMSLRLVPRAGSDFGAWLEDRTNAVLDKDNVLAWPWSKQ